MFFQTNEETSEAQPVEQDRPVSNQDRPVNNQDRAVSDQDHATGQHNRQEGTQGEVKDYDYAEYTDYGQHYDTLFEPNGPRTLEDAKLPFGFRDFGG